MLRILLVDDAEQPRRIMAEMLREEGYAVAEAGNGREAVETYRRLRPLGVLMDVNMPVMDGFAAARAIRAQDAGARILLMSGLVTRERSWLARRSGAVALLPKPLDATRLLAWLDAWVREDRPQAAEKPSASSPWF